MLTILSQATLNRDQTVKIRGGHRRRWSEEISLDRDEDDEDVRRMEARRRRDSAPADFVVLFRYRRNQEESEWPIEEVLQLCERRKLRVRHGNKRERLRIDELYRRFSQVRILRDHMEYMDDTGIWRSLWNMVLTHLGMVSCYERLRITIDEHEREARVELGDRDAEIGHWALFNGRRLTFVRGDPWHLNLLWYADHKKDRSNVRDENGNVKGFFTIAEAIRFYESTDIREDRPGLEVFDDRVDAFVPVTPWQIKELEFQEPQICLLGTDKWIPATVRGIQSLISEFKERG